MKQNKAEKVGRQGYLSNRRHDSAWLKAGRSVSWIL